MNITDIITIGKQWFRTHGNTMVLAVAILSIFAGAGTMAAVAGTPDPLTQNVTTTNNSIDNRLEELHKWMDKKTDALNKEYDTRRDSLMHIHDMELETYDRKLDECSEWFDKQSDRLGDRLDADIRRTEKLYANDSAAMKIEKGKLISQFKNDHAELVAEFSKRHSEVLAARGAFTQTSLNTKLNEAMSVYKQKHQSLMDEYSRRHREILSEYRDQNKASRKEARAAAATVRADAKALRENTRSKASATRSASASASKSGKSARTSDNAARKAEGRKSNISSDTRKNKQKFPTHRVSISSANFSTIKSNTMFDIVYRQQPNPGYVEIECADSIVPHVVLDIKKGVLEIDYDQNMNNMPSTPIIYLSNNNLKKLDFGGLIKFKVDGDLNVDNLTIKGDGCTQFNIPSVTGNSLDVDLSDVSKLTVNDANMNSIKIKCVDASGAKFPSICARTVDAYAKFPANINLKGHCNKKNITNEGIGKIRDKGLIIESSTLNCGKTKRSGGIPQEP